MLGGTGDTSQNLEIRFNFLDQPNISAEQLTTAMLAKWTRLNLIPVTKPYLYILVEGLVSNSKRKKRNEAKGHIRRGL